MDRNIFCLNQIKTILYLNKYDDAILEDTLEHRV